MAASGLPLMRACSAINCSHAFSKPKRVASWRNSGTMSPGSVSPGTSVAARAQRAKLPKRNNASRVITSCLARYSFEPSIDSTSDRLRYAVVNSARAE